MTVAVIGGTGALGRLVVAGLAGRGIGAMVVSRSASGPGTAIADLVTGVGLPEAIADCDTVMLLASDYRRPREVDIGGAAHVLSSIGDRHLIFISIVGVDRHPLPYYQAKHEVEQMIQAGTPRYSIVRATQFHGFVASLIERMIRGPLCVVPWGYRYQPIDIGDVAGHLVDVAEAGPSGLLEDVTGPEVLGISWLARTYMTAKGRERPILALPTLGKVASAYRHGLHTNPGRAVGTTTWSEWLAATYPAPSL